MPTITIKNRFTSDIIFEGDYPSTKNAVLAAIIQKVSLSYADLSSADLSSADLSYADLRYANLRYANLSYADLRSTDLRYADLHSADLSSANLRYADLSYADLRSADLHSADLSSANLRSAKKDFRIIQFGPFGTVDQTTHYLPSIDQVVSGCWSGTLEEYGTQIAEKFIIGSELRTLFDSTLPLCRAARDLEKADPRPMGKAEPSPRPS
jgi:uncharacterized protein YjbI with pentapeptide repeats